MFPTWLGCVEESLNFTWGSACQSAEGEIILPGTTSSPTLLPTTSTPPPSSVASLTTRETTGSSSGGGDNTTTNTSTAVWPLVTGGMNGTRSNNTSLGDFRNSASRGVVEVSVGGMMCALLVLSAIAL